MKVKNFMKKLSALALGLGMTLGVASNTSNPVKRAEALSGWQRVTEIADIINGGTFILGYEAAAGSETIVPLRSDGANATTSANGYFYTGTTANSSTADTINFKLTISNIDNYKVTITKIDSNHINISMPNGNFYGATSGGTTKNSGRLYTSGSSNETKLKVESVSSTNNTFKLTADSISGSYKYLSYNTGNPRYAFYSSGQKPEIVFYKMDAGHTHTYSASWSSDDDYHWHAATCEHTSEVSEKAAHTWNAGVVTTQPTCTEEGVKTFTCTVCNKTKTEPVDALGHDWQVVSTTATCLESGSTSYECSRCHETKDVDGAALGHHLVEKEVIQPTCTEQGYTIFECDRAGCTHEEIDNYVEAQGHSWVTNPNNPDQEICEHNCGVAPRVVPSYQKITSVDDLVDGNKYLIVYESGNVALNGELTSDVASNTVSVTINNGKIKKTDALNKAALTYGASDGSFLGGGGKYIGHSGTSNTLNYTESAFSNTISFDKDGNFILNAGSDYVLRYNNTSGQYRFRYYKSGQQAIQLYGLPPEASIKSISVDATGTCAVGGTAQLTHSITAVGGASNAVTWSSSNESIATVDQSGLVTGVSGGDVTIRVTSNHDSSKYAECSFKVTVSVVAVKGISLNETAKTVVYGQQFTLTPTVSPENATDKSVSWLSSDENVVVVVDGECLAGDVDGTATITATTEDGGFTATCVVTVKHPDAFDAKYENVIVYRDGEESTIMDGWSNSYVEHEYTDAATNVVTKFSAASKPATNSAISNMPVTKKGTVTIEAPTGKCFTNIEMFLKQWGSYTQTVSISVNDNAIATTSEFYIDAPASDIPENTSVIVFDFSGDKQVGINGISFNLADKTTETLATPTNLLFDSATNTLSWNEVENASGYQVKIGNGQYVDVETNSKVLEGLDSETTYTVYVVAKGDEESYSNSESASLEFTTPAIPLEDGVYTVVINSTNFSKTGSGNGYADYDGVRSVNVKASDTNNEGVIKVRSSNVMISSSKLQFKKAVQSYIEITTGLGTIVSVKAGEEELTSETSPAVVTGDTLKILADNADSTIQLENITITFEIGECKTYQWVNGSEVLYQVRQNADLEAPAYVGETPTKASDASHSYAFSNWSAGSEENGVVTYEAEFSSSVIVPEAYEELSELTQSGDNFIAADGSTISNLGSDGTFTQSNPLVVKADAGKKITKLDLVLENESDVTFDLSDDYGKTWDYVPKKSKASLENLPEDLGDTNAIRVNLSSASSDKVLGVDVKSAQSLMEGSACAQISYSWTEYNDGTHDVSLQKTAIKFVFDFDSERAAKYFAPDSEYTVKFVYNLGSYETLTDLCNSINVRNKAVTSNNVEGELSFALSLNAALYNEDFSCAVCVYDNNGDMVDWSHIVVTSFAEVYKEAADEFIDVYSEDIKAIIGSSIN